MFFCSVTTLIKNTKTSLWLKVQIHKVVVLDSCTFLNLFDTHTLSLTHTHPMFCVPDILDIVSRTAAGARAIRSGVKRSARRLWVHVALLSSLGPVAGRARRNAQHFLHCTDDKPSHRHPAPTWPCHRATDGVTEQHPPLGLRGRKRTNRFAYTDF